MAHVCNHEGAVLNAKVGMGEIGQYSYHLILVSESSDQRADRPASSEIVQQFQLVLDPQRATRDIYLLQRNEFCFFPPCWLVFHSPSFGWRLRIVILGWC